MSAPLNDPNSDRIPPPREVQRFEMDDSGLTRTPSRQTILQRVRPRAYLAGLAKHTLGLLLLLCVVFLWTMSNFLGSSIFADNTYAKPFFMTYLNTSTFMFAIIPTLVRTAYKRYRQGNLYSSIRSAFSRRRSASVYDDSGADVEPEAQSFLKPDDQTAGSPPVKEEEKPAYLPLMATARLSFAFCVLWFAANYFAMACLQFTTVASTTILTSTSSVWTLLIGALTGTEKFTWRKLCGVLASLVGIGLISRVDLGSSHSDSTSPSERGLFVTRAIETFPDKPASELALGDLLALLSAVLYGFYTIKLKKTSLAAAPLQLNMFLFFGLVGVFNIFVLLPAFPILHFTKFETFELPPTRRIWFILIANSLSSFLSDICWAYAMVLTSPLVVTVGLSLTIPLSLVGEMVIQGRYEGWIYWVGAVIVVGSFLFVDREETREELEAEAPVEDHGIIAEPVVQENDILILDDELEDEA